MVYYYAIKNDLVYKKESGDKRKYPWDVYSTKSHMWVVCNKTDKDFKASDYISEEEAFEFRDELEEKAKKHVGRPRKKVAKQLEEETVSFIKLPECPKYVEINIPIPADDLEEKDKTSQDASSIDSKSDKNEMINCSTDNSSTGNKDENKVVEDNKYIITPDIFFVHKGYLFKVTSTITTTYPEPRKMVAVYADYLSSAQGKFVPWGNRISIDDVENNIISNEDAEARIAQASSVNIKEEGAKTMEKEKDNIDLVETALNEVQKELSSYHQYKVGNGLEATVLNAAPKSMIIKVPQVLTEGYIVKLNNNMYVWKVTEIIDPKDERVRPMIAMAIVDALSDDTSKKEDKVDTVIELMKESYVRLEALYEAANPEGGLGDFTLVADRYLSKSDLEDRIAEIILPGEKSNEE